MQVFNAPVQRTAAVVFFPHGIQNGPLGNTLQFQKPDPQIETVLERGRNDGYPHIIGDQFENGVGMYGFVGDFRPESPIVTNTQDRLVIIRTVLRAEKDKRVLLKLADGTKGGFLNRMSFRDDKGEGFADYGDGFQLRRDFR